MEYVKLSMARMPFIFVKGRPKSIDRMDKMELKKFIQHLLVVCEKRVHPVPEWWPPAINWLKFVWNTLPILELKTIVLSCYAYHNELYTLYLSDQLAKMDFKQLKFKLISDNVTAIFNRLTERPLLVTVNENLVSVLLYSYIIDNFRFKILIK
jgi:hypothetical protein